MNVTSDNSLLILGRQPALSLAELESLYGEASVRPIGASAALVSVDPCRLAFDRLGGSVKFCMLLASIDTAKWHEVIDFLVGVAPGQSLKMPPGKMHLGLSAFGFDISPAKINASGLTLKKAIGKTGRSVRLVPNNACELTSAQVIHNKLTSPNGWELVIVRDGANTLVAQTIKVQNIASYTLRDRGRPKRDARVGMLPPKLAQIIINLAVGELPADKLASICEIPAGSHIPRPNLGKTVLDPFCGTGVILQEAMLMGYTAVGSDIDPRMGDCTQANLDWLQQKFPEIQDIASGWQLGDATKMNWEDTEFIEENKQVTDTKRVPALIDFVASETYLGRPFTSQPGPEIIAKTASEVDLILKKFLKNIHGQLAPGTRLCLAVPAWQISPGSFKHLSLVDQIGDLGYNRIGFKHASDRELIYYRPDQIVARELLVLTRK